MSDGFTPYAASAVQPVDDPDGIHDPGAAFLALVAIGVDRVVYYGVRALLVLYLVDERGLTMESVGTWLAAVGTGMAVGPVVGGLLALLTGPTVLVGAGAGLAAVGLGILGFLPAEWAWVSLALLTLGEGVLKPNLYALIGGRFHGPGTDTSRVAAFAVAYVVLNVGAFLGPVATGLARDVRVEWTWMFGAGALGFVGVGALGVASGGLGRLPEVPLSDPRMLPRMGGALLLAVASAAFWLPASLASQQAWLGPPVPWLPFLSTGATLVFALVGLFALVVAWRLEVRVPLLAGIGACLLVVGPGALLGAGASGLGTPAMVATLVLFAAPEVAIGALGMARVSAGLPGRLAPLALGLWMGAGYAGSMVATALAPLLGALPVLGVSTGFAVVLGAVLLAGAPWLRRTLFEPEPLD